MRATFDLEAAVEILILSLSKDEDFSPPVHPIHTIVPRP